MKTSIFTILLGLFSLLASAQGENNVWTFGKKKGLDFNPGTPAAYPNNISTEEAAAAACDEDGNLLFYSNSLNVWDRTHTVMPNGAGIMGSVSSTQGAVITQLKSTDSLYWLFTVTDVIEGTGTLRFSIVDMRLNGGYGDVPYKNIYIASNQSEKMVVIGNCSHQWLITHHRDSGIFYAYELGTGISMPAPVISKLSASAARLYVMGEMKASPNNRMLALANAQGDKHGLELYDFDPASGVVSNLRIIDTNGVYYTLEFSPDNKLLYAGNLAASGPSTWDLEQYDLSTGTLPAIRASKKVIYNTSPMVGLRRAPDSMIYAINGTSLNIHRIRKPDIPGTACDFEKDFITSATPYQWCGTLGSPFLQIRFDTIIYRRQEQVVCRGDSLTVDNTGAQRIRWQDGSTAAIRKLPPLPATYWVKTIKDCICYLDTFVIKAIPELYRATDTMICEKGAMLFARPGADSVTWSDGAKTDKKTITASGLYWVKSSFKCSTMVDTYKVTFIPYHETSILTDTLVCFQSQATFSGPGGFDTYLWSEGSTARDTLIRDDASFSVLATSFSRCEKVNHSFKVQFVKYIHLPKDTFFCKGDTLTLDATVNRPGAQYQWSTGETTPQVQVSRPGMKNITVKTGTCSHSQDIQVTQSTLQAAIAGQNKYCNDQQAVLTADVAGATYLWSTGDTSKTLLLPGPGYYTVRISQDGCLDSAGIEVSMVNCTNCVHIPNAFTPNGDGRNDLFGPIISCPLRSYKLIIVNRWGLVQFESTDPAEKWDGSKNGASLESNVLFYLLKVKFDLQGDEEQLYKGDVTLIR